MQQATIQLTSSRRVGMRDINALLSAPISRIENIGRVLTRQPKGEHMQQKTIQLASPRSVGVRGIAGVPVLPSLSFWS